MEELLERHVYIKFRREIMKYNLVISFSIWTLCDVHLLLIVTFDELCVVIRVGVVHFVVLYGGRRARICKW